MIEQFKELQKGYEDIPIPSALDHVIDTNILRGVQSMKQSIKRRIFKYSGIIAASFIIIIGIGVNSNIALASSIYELPIIGNLGELMTLRDYHIETVTSKTEVVQPQLTNLTNTEVEQQINELIETKVNELIEEQAILDEEYKEAYIETGGKEDDFRKVETTINYKKYFISESLISFEITKFQTLANAYNDYIYYTLDLESGEPVELSDLLGPDYELQIKKSVIESMNDPMKNGESIDYDLDVVNDMTFDTTRPFFVDKDGSINIVFYKYEVAAGVHGLQVFNVGKMIEQ